MTCDDPKLTAYALNELDEADRAEVEAFLAENEAARRFVEETRRSVAMLTAGMREVTMPALTAVQKREIAVAAAAPAPVVLSYPTIKRRRPEAWRRFALAAAACAAIAGAGYLIFLGQSNPPRSVSLASSAGGARLSATQAQVTYGSELTLNPTANLGKSQSGQQSVGGNSINGWDGVGTRATYGNLSGSDASKTGGPLYDWRTVSPATTSGPGYIPAPFVMTGTGASATPTLTSSQAAFPGKVDVKIVGTTGNGQTNNTTLFGNPGTPNYSFLDVEGATGNASATAGRTQSHGDTITGNFRMFPGTGDIGSDTGSDNGFEMRRAKGEFPQKIGGKPISSGESIQSVDASLTYNGWRNDPSQAGSVTGSSAAVSGKHIPYVNRFNDGKNPGLQNSATSGVPAFSNGEQMLSRADIDALVAHYRNRGADGYHLLDGGVVGYTQEQFEKDAKTGNFPPEVVAAMQRQYERTASAPNESYAVINDNPFLPVAEQPLSTFSIDVDTASYSNIRRFLNEGHFPPPDAVRIEEMLNYFPYQYEKPKSDSKEPFAATVEIAGCPWNSAHRLARVAIKGREIAHDKRPVSNLVFLIDVSGSMNEPAKLPLVKEGLKLMVNELTENDRISIVVYAGNAGLVLPSTTADPKHKQSILDAIENLSAGGSTNGGEGIQLAYKIATDNFIKGGTNRVLLATDGDWNVGITDQTSLMGLIQDEAKSGVFLSVLGYGFGNLKDATMEKLADKGNGHYAYIDGIKESKKVLIEEMSSTLVTIAKDVKIQVEFNPLKVESYRLIGYEKRLLRKEDFNNDKVDAGEIGAGHCVTALYEITPMGADAKGKNAPATAPQAAEVDALKYQKHEVVKSDDLMTLKMRYKQPDGEASTKIEFPAIDKGVSYSKASEDFKFSAAVAQFGMVLRNSPYRGTASLDGVLELADEGKGKDEKGYRTEFLEMVKKAKALTK